MNEKVLNEQDRLSGCWLRLRAHYEKRLASLRVQNDGNLNENDTARLRGKIAEVKALLDLGVEKPVIEDDQDKFKD